MEEFFSTANNKGKPATVEINKKALVLVIYDMNKSTGTKKARNFTIDEIEEYRK